MSSMRTDMGGVHVIERCVRHGDCRRFKSTVKWWGAYGKYGERRVLKLGDIISYRNGVTAEVLNTDAEAAFGSRRWINWRRRTKSTTDYWLRHQPVRLKIAVGNDYHSVLSLMNTIGGVIFAENSVLNRPVYRLRNFTVINQLVICGYC